MNKAHARPHSDVTSRQVALTIVDLVMQSDNEMAVDWLDQHFKRLSIPWRDRALITELVYGTIRRILTLDWMLARYTFHRVKDHLLKNILRLGVYQIYFLDRVPVYAIVNEMVQIAKYSMGEPKARFVNAVLRRAAAKDIPLTETGLKAMSDMSPLRILSVAHAMPLWLLERWRSVYSQEEIRQMCLASNATPTIFIRANTNKIRVDELKTILEQEGAQATLAQDPRMLKLRPPKSIESLDSFRKGFFFVQDPMTLRIVDFMQVDPSETILDMCAAPGGKSFAIEGETGRGENIVALEKNPSRLQLARENAQRLGSKVRWMEFDRFQVEDQVKFDKILLDAPCSNQGVFARRVEARWRLSPERIEKLTRLQHELLEDAKSRLKLGGAIYYSTCSIDAVEDEGVVQSFLKSHKSWVCEKSLKILPEAGKNDGGFVARLVYTKVGKIDGREKGRKGSQGKGRPQAG